MTCVYIYTLRGEYSFSSFIFLPEYPFKEKRRGPSEVTGRGTVNKSMLDERRARSGTRTALTCYSGKKKWMLYAAL